MPDPLGLINTNAAGGINPAQSGAARPNQTANSGPSFKDVLMKNIEQVNQLQQDAATAIEDLAAGRRDDLVNVLNAKRKADEAFKLLLSVRNKMVDAFEEIKQMRV